MSISSLYYKYLLEMQQEIPGRYVLQEIENFDDEVKQALNCSNVRTKHTRAHRKKVFILSVLL